GRRKRAVGGRRPPARAVLDLGKAQREAAELEDRPAAPDQAANPVGRRGPPAVFAVFKRQENAVAKRRRPSEPGHPGDTAPRRAENGPAVFKTADNGWGSKFPGKSGPTALGKTVRKRLARWEKGPRQGRTRRPRAAG